MLFGKDIAAEKPRAPLKAKKSADGFKKSLKPSEPTTQVAQSAAPAEKEDEIIKETIKL
jgi:hypothetical protein